MFKKIRSKLKAFAQNKHVQAVSILFASIFLAWLFLFTFFKWPVESLLICFVGFIIWCIYLLYKMIYKELIRRDGKRYR